MPSATELIYVAECDLSVNKKPRSEIKVSRSFLEMAPFGYVK